VEREHGLGGWDGGIEAVDLQDVDVGCAEAAEGSVDGVEDCGAGEAWVVVSTLT